MTDLLPFQRSIIEQMLAEDGLCVMAPGMGLHQIVAVLLRLQDVRLKDPEQHGTVIIIGSTPWQRLALRQELTRILPPIERFVPPGDAAAPPDLPPEVTAEIPTTERLRLYRSCSCLFITTRILVVDLLSGRLNSKDVAGIIVMGAHRVSDSSGEGFAVRLYRSANASGFIRAFSDAPSAFASEFGKAEKVLRALYVRRMHLWPRFQIEVQEDLEARPPELVEISLSLDSGAALVYEGLAELIDGCMKDLRRLERLDTTDLTASRGLSASLDESVLRQLAPVWHTVSPRTRQIVADLRTLRALTSFLLKFDPVTFLTYLDTLRATEGTYCAWLFHSAAHTVFEAAKGRVYILAAPPHILAAPPPRAAGQRKRKTAGKDDGAGLSSGNITSAAAVPIIEPVLEEPPKWQALLEVLEEARADRCGGGGGGSGNRQISSTAAAAAADTASPPPHPPVVVFCADEYTCRQLRGVAGPDGPQGHMRNMYREYLQYKIDSTAGGTGGRRGGGSASGIGGNDNNYSNHVGGRGGGRGGAGGAPVSRMVGGYVAGEEAALAKEARVVGATRNKGRGERQGAAKRGGGRGNGGGRGGRGGSATAAATAAAAALGAAAAAASSAEPSKDGGAPSTTTTSPSKQQNAAVDPPDVRFVSLDAQGSLALWEFDPTYVVVYDPDVALTRSLEVFKAQRRSRPLRVYLLRYDDSPEMDKYQSAVVRERNAFESLIKAKGVMALPTTTATVRGAAGPSQALVPVPGTDALTSASLSPGPEGNAITRRGGGRLTARPERVRIVVDVREFMSPLPAVLHGQGFQVVPLTLEVGDYVLSPEICVERKSLSDLRGSLISGRLYQQAEAMCKHYTIAVLLIEFDGDRAFALQSNAELGDDIQSHAMMSRLVLLCLHHPRLRLVWSRSLHATADIFKRLKANHEEPDPVAAATVGLEGDVGGAGGGETTVNTAAIDLLRRLPGVTDGNYRSLMREGGSLAGLAGMPLARLQTVMGGDQAAKKLYDFLSQECRALFKGL